jgi:hypothetical protein
MPKYIIYFETIEDHLNSCLLPQISDIDILSELLISVTDYDVCPLYHIADYFRVSKSEARTYVDTARYLGLLTRTSRNQYMLTDLGISALSVPFFEVQFVLAKAIVDSWIGVQLIKSAESRGSFTTLDIADVIRTGAISRCNERFSEVAFLLANRIVIDWIEWLAEEIGYFTVSNGTYGLVTEAATS